jgi:superfamily II DNA/RNA helicase
MSGNGNFLMQNTRTNKTRGARSNFRSQAGHRTFGGPKNARRKAPALDIHAFIQKSTRKVNDMVEEVIIENTFSDFALAPEIQANLERKGYKIPTPIQDQSINHILDGKDLIGMANTGTGKTAAFLLPLINKVHNDKSQKVLIIAPTRELALQIEAELRQFAWGMKIFYTSVVGGMPIGKQIGILRKTNPNFVIGTPGRIKDLANRGFINFASFNNVVLDEVDRMLDMGFVQEIKYFLSKLPEKRQTLYFSATMPPKIKSLIETFSVNPVVVQTKSQETSVNVAQEVVRAGGLSKFGKLTEILRQSETEKVLIFSETKRGVEKLSIDLINSGFKAESIHGDKTQGKRQRALRDFKECRVDILVATDVAARGLDINDVTHVINYTVPQTYEDYVHRIGRTGRGNALGKALTFVE